MKRTLTVLTAAMFAAAFAVPAFAQAPPRAVGRGPCRRSEYRCPGRRRRGDG